jgi:hypothetical protein
MENRYPFFFWIICNFPFKKESRVSSGDGNGFIRKKYRLITPIQKNDYTDFLHVQIISYENKGGYPPFWGIPSRGLPLLRTVHPLRLPG